MTHTRNFTIGSDVSCSDGVCGELLRVVVDPVARALTHLVVEPHGRGMGRLVPVDLVESAGGTIRLRCTIAQFDALEGAEETHFLPGARGEWSYEQRQMLSWPYYGLGGGMGHGRHGRERAGHRHAEQEYRAPADHERARPGR